MTDDREKPEGSEETISLRMLTTDLERVRTLAGVMPAAPGQLKWSRSSVLRAAIELGLAALEEGQRERERNELPLTGPKT